MAVTMVKPVSLVWTFTCAHLAVGICSFSRENYVHGDVNTVLCMLMIAFGTSGNVYFPFCGTFQAIATIFPVWFGITTVKIN